MSDKWNVRFLQMATFIASWSKDPSTGIGAVIVDDDKKIISHGYNGFPRGAKDDERLYDRKQKYARVIHAEENAIINAVGSLVGTTVYLTHPPCLHCSGMLNQVGVKKVVFVEPSADFRSRWNLEEITTYLDELGIEYLMFKENF